MEDSSKKRSSWPIVAFLVLVFVLYPLSVGPAAWVLKKTQSDWFMTFGEWFYSPLEFLMKRNDTVMSLLLRYVEWWIA